MQPAVVPSSKLAVVPSSLLKTPLSHCQKTLPLISIPHTLLCKQPIVISGLIFEIWRSFLAQRMH